MVSSTNQERVVKLSKANFDTNTRLGFKPDYYDCVICLDMATTSDILECPVCHASQCQACLQNYTQMKCPNAKPGELRCSQCNKEFKFLPTNKLMTLLLTKHIKFGCKLCNRYWGYEDYQRHKLKGLCVKDPSAVNSIASLEVTP